VAAIAQLFMLSVANSTISARIASTRAIFRRRARISNSLRSLSFRPFSNLRATEGRRVVWERHLGFTGKIRRCGDQPSNLTRDELLFPT
jgi:hypothetical protein